MRYELDFYGTKIYAFVDRGQVQLLRRDVAALFDVDNTDEMMEPILKYVENELVPLAAVQREMPTLIQHVMGNTVASSMEERQNLMDILSDELVENLIKQLTYDKHILPLVKMPREMSTSGIITLDIDGTGSETYFTFRSVNQLMGYQGVIRIPEDTPFCFVLVRDLTWDSAKGGSTMKTHLEKIIPLYYMDHVLKYNIGFNDRSISPLRSCIMGDKNQVAKVVLSDE